MNTKIVLLVLVFTSFSYTQVNEEKLTCQVYAVLPTIVGGLDTLNSLIQYPDSAKKFNIEGKVYFIAYLDSLGNLDSAKIIKGLGFGIDQEALRVVSLIQFTPAYSHKLISPRNAPKREYTLVPAPSAITFAIAFKLK